MAKATHNHLNKLNFITLSIALALGGCNSDNNPNTTANSHVTPSDLTGQVSSGDHVASPDWQDQIIYFLMIDRFNDGNSLNNNQGQNEYDPTSKLKFSGGDLQGVTDQLSYIQGLGATSIWITPPVANQWWDSEQNYGGFHGYWARDFQKIDEHFGDIESYQNLAKELHKRDMYLIQDIVTNHVGNFFTYDKPEEYDPSNPCKGFRLIKNALPSGQSLPYPLNRNQCQASGSGSYHWTPAFTDHSDPDQEKKWQLSDLDDLNTSVPEIRAYLKASYRKWIKEIGIDAFRVDTAKFVEHDFWNDFFHSENGIMAQAKATGRKNFLTFGEVFEASTPYHTEGEEKMLTYIGENGSPEQLMAVLNFPLQTTMTRVFASGQPTDYLRYRLEQMMDLFPNPYIMPNFIDNHDMPRFLSQGSQNDMQMALLTMMTIPGIPVIYQGTEQAMVNSRDSMFSGGNREDGQFIDSFDTDSEMYHFIQALSQLRKENKVLTRGDLKVIASNKTGAGILSFTRSLDDENVLVIMNTSSSPMLLKQMDVNQDAGTVFERRIQSNWKGAPATLTTDKNGDISMELAPKSAVVYFKTAQTGNSADTSDTNVTLNSDWNNTAITQDTDITGTATPGATLKLVVDGNLGAAQEILVDDNGDWGAKLTIRHFGIGKQQHRFAIYHAGDKTWTEDTFFTSDLSWPEKPDLVIDDAGDAQDGSGGPFGNYHLPTEATFDKNNSQMAIEKTEVYTEGSNVRLKLTMAKVTDSWLPPNGFDHAGFSIFIGLPDEAEQGLTQLPKINAAMPTGKWNRNAVIFGWQSSIYNTVDADAQTWGETVSPAPNVSVDKESNVIYIDFASDALGRPESLDGISFYITTWDLDGLSAAYRPLDTQQGLWNFAGTGASEPKIWDDVQAIIRSK